MLAHGKIKKSQFGEPYTLKTQIHPEICNAGNRPILFKNLGSQQMITYSIRMYDR